jgi:hypothetical protein
MTHFQTVPPHSRFVVVTSETAASFERSRSKSLPN